MSDRALDAGDLCEAFARTLARWGDAPAMRSSDGRVQLRVGTLYGVLDRLVADGLAERDREEIHNGRLRRYYRLTDAGIDSLVAEVERMTANVRAASGVLRNHGVRPAAGGLAITGGRA